MEPADATPGESPQTDKYVTKAECLAILEGFIRNRKPGLAKFYSSTNLDAFAARAQEMIQILVESDGCTLEMAKDFSILVLYDILMLLDDSGSMRGEGNERIRTMKNTLMAVANIYDYANETGIRVRFLNSRQGRRRVTREKVGTLLDQHYFHGVTMIGTELRNKILRRFIWEQEMQKPALIIVLTDGEVEGERLDVLRRVILDTYARLCNMDNPHGKNAVAFHFARVGNDREAKTMLEEIDSWGMDNVYCLPAEDKLEDIEGSKKWTLSRKLLLGSMVDDNVELGQDIDNAPLEDDDSDYLHDSGSGEVSGGSRLIGAIREATDLQDNLKDTDQRDPGLGDLDQKDARLEGQKNYKEILMEPQPRRNLRIAGPNLQEDAVGGDSELDIRAPSLPQGSEHLRQVPSEQNITSPQTIDVSQFRLETIFDKESESVTHRVCQQGLWVETKWSDRGQIGKGGFGEVKKQESADGKLRAVKRIFNPDTRHREIKALIMIKDRTDLFVEFLGWYQKDQYALFITTEYVENGDLSKYLKDNGRIPDNVVCEITKQVLEGLVELAKHKIAHRDLKPQNILVSRPSPIKVKLADFGAARERRNEIGQNTKIGTPRYSPPEFHGVIPYPKKTSSYALDIWSLGCIVHEMATSIVPFTSEPDTDVQWSTQLSNNTASSDDIEITEAEIDMELMMDFCKGRKPLPLDSLQQCGASVEAIDFITRALMVQPKLRPSPSQALEALRAQWFSKAGDKNAPSGLT